jgi:exodeoxyribonuclease-5
MRRLKHWYLSQAFCLKLQHFLELAQQLGYTSEVKYSLSADQIAALQQIGRWYRSQSAPYLTLGGYAGTGKTTLLAYVRQALRENYPDSRVAFAAYTGKAVRVLEKALRGAGVAKRKDSISTLHSLIYNAEVDGAGRFVSWRKKSELDFELIIVDEASMISEEIWKDLLSFDVPVLAAGDHGQLPPINSQFNLMSEPQLKLESVLRQNQDSPIIRVATLARSSGQIPPDKYGPGVVKLDRQGDNIAIEMEELLESWRPEWLVLCGYNHTRVRLNAELRARSGFELPGPSPGDKVVCLRNNRTSKIYNGMTGRILSLEPASGDEDDKWWFASIELEDLGSTYEGYVLREQFGAKETLAHLPPSPNKKQRGDLFDFGYALTVHKAQGSQAETVLVFEERSRHMSDDDWRRWLYTAVTRAEQRLYIVG